MEGRLGRPVPTTAVPQETPSGNFPQHGAHMEKVEDCPGVRLREYDTEGVTVSLGFSFLFYGMAGTQALPGIGDQEYG